MAPLNLFGSPTAASTSNMSDNDVADGRRGLSGAPRKSRLPQWGPDRRHDAVQKADSHPVSRKSSQLSARSAESSNTGGPEALRKRDTTKFHQRDSSLTSQESYDTSGPDTPLSAKKSSLRKGNTPRVPASESGQSGSFDLDSPSRRSKSVTIAPSPDSSPTEPLSYIPRSPGIKRSSPRESFRRSCSLQFPTDPKMADRVDNKPKPTHLDPRQLGGRRPGFGEDSYVQIDGLPTQDSNDQDSMEDWSVSKSHDSIGEDAGGSSGGQTQRDSTYASALKSGLSDDYARKEQSHDDDDSYPELDDMSMEEMHRPPPRNPNGGIRWAPWNVPFKRRAQTLVVLLHSLSIVATVSLFFTFCANPFAWPLLLIYLLHVLSSKAATDGSLKYRSEWIRKSYVWHFFADYYPARLHKTHDLPATRKYIFGYHPHGIISHGAWAAFATDALGFSQKFPGITNSLLTLDSNFRIPFYREYLLSMGVRSVSKESIVNILNKGGPNGEGMGRGVTVVVGGARESLEAQPGMMRLVLKERKGFIKLAVRCGADLVPVLAFGENNLYDQLQPQDHPFMHRIQMFVLKVWKFTLPFLHGRGIFNYDVGLMPYRRPLNVVVGAPIKVRQSSLVEMEEINRLHDLYVAELEKLWDRYKHEFAPDRKEEMQILP